MISREGLGISWYNISTPVAGWAVPEDIVVIRNSLDLKPIEHSAENTWLWKHMTLWDNFELFYVSC